VLFAIGFISLFVAGGLSGVFLARHDLPHAAASQDFVTGHFHLVMGVAATFAILAGLFFWFPKLFGTRMNEALGKTHFWLTFAGVYCIFMPMHWMGLLTQPTVFPGAQEAALASVGGSIRTLVTAATLWTLAAQVLFVANFFGSLWRPRTGEENNPWGASTLEWSVASPVPEASFGGQPPVVYRGAYEFAPQHLSPELLAQKAQ
jgi:cytochrome c oxidase subunit I